MEPTQELVDAIYREKVLRARATPPEQKWLSGAELFDEVCERMRLGLKYENPDADDATLDRLLVERLDRLERLRGIR
jgi:hypothetical protein